MVGWGHLAPQPSLPVLLRGAGRTKRVLLLGFQKKNAGAWASLPQQQSLWGQIASSLKVNKEEMNETITKAREQGTI